MRRADAGFIIHFVPGPLSLVQALMELSSKWKSQVSKSQGYIPDFTPLRVTLLRCVVGELQRIDKLLKDQEMQRAAIQQGALVDNGDKAKDPLTFRMLRWDSQQQTMVVETHPATMTSDETALRIKTLVEESANTTNVMRFHAKRPMTGSGSKTIVILEISSRAHVLHQALLDLCGHPIWSLVSAALRPEGMKRTPLAQALAKRLEMR